MNEQAYSSLDCHLGMLKPETQDVQFSSGTSYPILTTFERGNHIIDGQPFYFAQTTFQVRNDLGEICYVPFNSSDHFTKRRHALRDLETGDVVTFTEHIRSI
jgi:hypothetical protein